MTRHRPADSPQANPPVVTGTRLRRFQLFYQGLCRSTGGPQRQRQRCTRLWWLIAFQWGVTVASRSQLGFPA